MSKVTLAESKVTLLEFSRIGTGTRYLHNT